MPVADLEKQIEEAGNCELKMLIPPSRAISAEASELTRDDKERPTRLISDKVQAELLVRQLQKGARSSG